MTRLTPLLSKSYQVDHFDNAEKAIAAIKARGSPYAACVAKLGSKGNLGIDVMKAIREAGGKTFIAVHSATAWNSESTRRSLSSSIGVNLFVAEHNEDELLEQLGVVFFGTRS